MFFCGAVAAYDPAYDADNPTDLGTMLIRYDSSVTSPSCSDLFSTSCGSASTSTRWKSIRVQATSSGTATHFVIQTGATLSNKDVGFAVYADGGSGEAPGTPLGRGYYASYVFGTRGFYALPFTSVSSISIVSGSYYVLVYFIEPGSEADTSGWRLSNGPYPEKWGSQCSAEGCDADMPPGYGTETWSIEYAGSASWGMGLLATESTPVAVPRTVTGVTVSGGGIR